MIREERNALFLLLLFTAAAGLFYMLVLKPVLSDVTTTIPERANPPATQPDDPRPKSAQRMVGLRAWLRDAVSGRPLQDARVHVLDIGDIIEPSLSLSPEGQLRVEFLPPSITFGLLLECDGYRPRRFSRLRSRARTIIDLGLVALEPQRSLRGSVRDAAGAPVGDSVVSLFLLAPATSIPTPLERAARLADALLKNAVATTRTDSEGAYSFQNLPPGLYAAYSTRRSYGSVIVPDLDLRYGDRRLQIHVRSARPLQGEVQRPPGVKAISNGRLVAVEAAAPLAAQLSAAISKLDDQGHYALGGLSDAPHFLFPVGDQLVAAGYGPRILALLGGTDIPSEPGLELGGTLLDSDRLPVAGALIEVRASLPGALLRVAASGEDGRFRILGLPRGAASLLIRRDGLAPHRTSVLIAPSRESLPPMTLLPPARLSGRVMAADRPLVGAVVRCPAYDLQTLTDSTGHYSLEGLPPGRLLIGAEAPGYARHESPLEVRLRGENRLDFDLHRGGSLAVVIKGPGDVPIPQARVLAIEVGDDQDFRTPPIRGLTNSRGGTRIRGLRLDGKIVLMAHAPGHAPMRSEPFELTDRLLRAGVALTLRPGGSIDGVCRDPDGNALPGVYIRAFQVEASELDRALLSLASAVAWSGPDGRFSLTDLPAGALRLWAGRSGRLSTASAAARIQESTLLTHFDLVVPPAIDLSGRVLDAAGQPVAHARVTVIIQDQNHPLANFTLTTLTPADGSFHLLRPDADILLITAELENRGQAEMLLDRRSEPPLELVLETP